MTLLPARVLLAAAGLLLTVGAAHALTPAEVFARVSPSVWRVTTYDRDGLPLGQGSGVVTGPEAVVTNCHVLRRAQRVAVRHEKTTITATLSHWDVQRDVCQLKAPGLVAPTVAFADTARLNVGQDVYAIGHPKGLDLTMSAGLISSFRRNENSQLVLIQTSAAVSAGSSGGGLFDNTGRLIGLVTIGSVGADTQNLNFAIPVDWVRDLPERHARLNPPATAASGATAAASGATTTTTTTSAPAPTPKSRPTPASGQHETATTALNDLSRLPYASDRMRERYSQFLTRPLPRAFVISESGDWRLAWGKSSSGSSGPPAERALKECEALKRARCFVYAIDNEVVYQGQ